MLKRSFFVFTLLVLAASFTFAQEQIPEKKPAQITGYLVDNMCAKGKDREDRLHETSCSLMPKCVETGYSIVAKDTTFKLDENGNKLALEILKATKQKKGLAVRTMGTVKDGILYVDSMIEIPHG